MGNNGDPKWPAGATYSGGTPFNGIKTSKINPDMDRIQELDTDITSKSKWLEIEILDLKTEVKRLTDCLARANSQAEHFEREWYLLKDQIETAKTAERKIIVSWLRNSADKHDQFWAARAIEDGIHLTDT